MAYLVLAGSRGPLMFKIPEVVFKIGNFITKLKDTFNSMVCRFLGLTYRGFIVHIELHNNMLLTWQLACLRLNLRFPFQP